MDHGNIQAAFHWGVLINVFFHVYMHTRMFSSSGKCTYETRWWTKTKQMHNERTQFITQKYNGPNAVLIYKSLPVQSIESQIFSGAALLLFS